MVSKKQAQRVKRKKRYSELRKVANGEEQIIDSPNDASSTTDCFENREPVHVVDINGRIMDYPKTFAPIDDFSKSLPRNF